MNVLFVYKYLTVGGVEAVLRARLEGLPSHGVNAQAWFLADHGGRALFRGVDARIHVGDVRALEHHMRHERFDVITSIDTEEVFPLFGGGDQPAPLVVEAHSAYLENLGYLRHCDDRVKAVFAPSASHATLIRRYVGGKRPVRVLPNPVHQAFVDDTTPGASRSPRPIVAWIGRLDDQKNWKAFIEVASRMLSGGAEPEFWMVGRPTPPRGAQDLRKLASRAGVLPRLRWLSGVPFHVMPRILDEVRDSGGVTVSTSRGESFGMTVAEAMARACAVVVPDQAPFTDFVDHRDTGHRYRPGSAVAAAQEAMTLLADDNHRAACGHRGRRRILARHSPSAALTTLAAEMRAVAERYADRP